MSLSWDDDDTSRDDADWRTRLAAWFAPSPAELAGLAVLVVGALLLSGALWLQATSRPTSFDPTGARPGADGASDEGLVGGGADSAGAAAAGSIGAGEIGARMDAAGAADGPAPGTQGDGTGPEAGSATDAGDGLASGRAADGGGGDANRSVVVHVTGAVRTTGLVTLPAGARIGDVVTAAGGARPDALVERVNLARIVVDGEHVHVPAEGDDPSTLPPIGGRSSTRGGVPAGAAGPGDAPGSTGPIHLNRASAAELETLPGIGPARAQAIITHREQQGPFTTPGDLRAVSGIGEATFQRLAPLITVE